MAGDVPSARSKFLIGSLGGAAPYALSFATYCMAGLSWETLPMALVAVGRVVGVVIFSSFGGLLAMIWDRKEKDLRRLFVVGMAAPAILFSTYVNIQNSVQRPSRSSISLERSNALRSGWVAPATQGEWIEEWHVAVSSETGERRSPRQSSKTFLEAMFSVIGAAGGNRGLSLVFGAVASIGGVWLGYRAWLTMRALRTTRSAERELTRRVVERSESDLIGLRETSVSTAVSVEDLTSLRKGDTSERGLSALLEGRFDEAIKLFNEAISEVSSPLWYRGMAYAGLNQWGRALMDWEQVVEVEQSQNRIAIALSSKGVALGELGRPIEAIAVYDEVVRRFGEAPEPALKEQVARTLVWKGVQLEKVGRGEEAIAAYNEVVRRFGETTEPALQEQVARALVGKGVQLGKLGRGEEAIAVYDEVVRRFGEAKEAILRETVARAFVGKGAHLLELNRSEEAIAACGEVIRRFGEALEPALREAVARALVNTGVIISHLDQRQEAIAVYDEVVRRFGEAPEPALREAVARALVDKGVHLRELNRGEEAIAVNDEVVRRFGEAPELGLRQMVARALLGKAVQLGKVDRDEEAIAVCDEVVRRFGEAPEPALRETVARALVGKGADLLKLNRREEAIAVYDEVVRRFQGAVEPALRDLVGLALLSREVIGRG